MYIKQVRWGLVGDAFVCGPALVCLLVMSFFAVFIFLWVVNLAEKETTKFKYGVSSSIFIV